MNKHTYTTQVVCKDRAARVTIQELEAEKPTDFRWTLTVESESDRWKRSVHHDQVLGRNSNGIPTVTVCDGWEVLELVSVVLGVAQPFDNDDSARMDSILIEMTRDVGGKITFS